MFFILCLFAYILMSQSTLVDLKNPDQKKKGCWSGWSSYQIYCWSGREKWECLGLASGVLAVRHSTFALCLMAVLTQGCSSCKCCFPYCKIQRSTPVHLLCVFVFDLLFGFVFFPVLLENLVFSAQAPAEELRQVEHLHKRRKKYSK